MKKFYGRLVEVALKAACHEANSADIVKFDLKDVDWRRQITYSMTRLLPPLLPTPLLSSRCPPHIWEVPPPSALVSPFGNEEVESSICGFIESCWEFKDHPLGQMAKALLCMNWEPQDEEALEEVIKGMLEKGARIEELSLELGEQMESMRRTLKEHGLMLKRAAAIECIYPGVWTPVDLFGFAFTLPQEIVDTIQD